MMTAETELMVAAHQFCAGEKRDAIRGARLLAVTKKWRAANPNATPGAALDLARAAEQFAEVAPIEWKAARAHVLLALMAYLAEKRAEREQAEQDEKKRQARDREQRGDPVAGHNPGFVILDELAPTDAGEEEIANVPNWTKRKDING